MFGGGSFRMIGARLPHAAEAARDRALRRSRSPVRRRCRALVAHARPSSPNPSRI